MSAMPTAPSASRAESAVPILPSADLSRAEAYYRYLGFSVLGRSGDYLRIARGRIELHLYFKQGLDARTNSAGCYLRVEDPQDLRGVWSGDGLPCLDVPGSQEYGATVFALVDPDGNTLRYGKA
jgi:catechol 2,3-dioxygenase-like lactoylglutathione lyase family enzyme